MNQILEEEKPGKKVVLKVKVLASQAVTQEESLSHKDSESHKPQTQDDKDDNSEILECTAGPPELLDLHPKWLPPASGTHGTLPCLQQASMVS